MRRFHCVHCGRFPCAPCVPSGAFTVWTACPAAQDPEAYTRASFETVVRHVRAMIAFQDAGSEVFDYGNNIRRQAEEGGLKGADRAFPGFVPAYIRPLFCEGKGPFRWVALSGDPEDIYATDQVLKELFPEDTHLCNWLDMARERVAFQGLPARICWLGYGERVKAGLAFNELEELRLPLQYPLLRPTRSTRTLRQRSKRSGPSSRVPGLSQNGDQYNILTYSHTPAL